MMISFMVWVGMAGRAYGMYRGEVHVGFLVGTPEEK